MDIAALSIGLANHQVRSDAGVAMMRNVMQTMEQQGLDLINLLQTSPVSAKHPSLGNAIDVKL